VKTALTTLINLQLQYDAGAVDKLLDPDFVYVSNDGSVVSRTEFINLTDREKNPLDILEVTDVQVRSSGDTAVATGTIHEKGLLYGKPYEFRGQTLITYAKRNGRWLCFAIHD
jgi:ketosteroid isomerase-like protein